MIEAGRMVRFDRDEDRCFLQLAIEHAPKEETRKGYTTTGITKQFLVNALNEVLGMDGWDVQAHYSQPTPGWGTQPESARVCTLRLRLKFWLEEAPIEQCVVIEREACGGHSDYHGDVGNSLKGAHTAAFKRACAEFGLGREAFEGALDPDFMAIGPPRERKASTPKEKSKEKPAAAPAGEELAPSVVKMYAWLEEKVPAVTSVPNWRDALADYCFVMGQVDITTATDSEELRKVLNDAGRALKALASKPKAVADLLKSATVQRHGGA